MCQVFIMVLQLHHCFFRAFAMKITVGNLSQKYPELLTTFDDWVLAIVDFFNINFVVS